MKARLFRDSGRFVPLLAALVGCAAAGVPLPAGTPVPDAAGFVRELETATMPAGPRQVTFGWTLDERGSRVRGRGVVRVEAPDRIRLDLFGPRGETYLSAALVDGEYRFPSAAPPPVELPSASLLWAALGVFRPPANASLEAASTEGDLADLRFRSPEGELFVYSFERLPTAGYRLARVERAGSRGVVESVSLDPDASGAPATTRYRDWSAYRDLTLEVESTREVEPFPSGIWSPGA